MNLACKRSYKKTYLVRGVHLLVVAGLMTGAVLARTLLKVVGNRRRLAHAGVLVIRIIAFEVDEITRTVAILIDIELVLVVDIAVDLPVDRVSVRRSGYSIHSQPPPLERVVSPDRVHLEDPHERSDEHRAAPAPVAVSPHSARAQCGSHLWPPYC